jgi:quercetin dioxygenase-like cupin family protein
MASIAAESSEVKVGDMIFIPAGIYHGMKRTRSTTWLNIRFPEHRN